MSKVAVFLLAAASFPVAAQWLNHPDPRTPRTKDGKPNLAAPAPRLNGKWRNSLPPQSWCSPLDFPSIQGVNQQSGASSSKTCGSPDVFRKTD